MNVAEAIRRLREDPQHVDLVRDAYIGEDTREAAERFSTSDEFIEALQLVRTRLHGGRALDLGAGRGIASYALARSGAETVYALEPDLSGEVGLGALRAVTADLPVISLRAIGEAIPLGDGSMDVVYVRSVLHHAEDLHRLLSECARVLKRAGLLLVCREHVVDDERQLEEFLRNHPVHQLARSENAYTLDEYVRAIERGGLRIQRILRPWDSIINAFPAVRTKEELDRLPTILLERRLGRAGNLLGHVPGVHSLVRALLGRRRPPGRLYSFLAIKP